MVLTRISPEMQQDRIEQFAVAYEKALVARTHLWIAMVAYHLADPSNASRLDIDQLIGPPNVGCFVCEMPYTGKAGGICSGEPR